MPYLLKIGQFDQMHTVGVFEFEENIHAFIRSIPFVEIETYEIDDVTFTDYSIPYQSLPASYLVRYCGADFLLSHTMFTDHENAIFFSWEPVHLWDEMGSDEADEPNLIEGMTRVDAYIIPNDEALAYIESREAIVVAVTEHFAEKGIPVSREFAGSEDGEALTYTDESGWHFLFHLDPMVVRAWDEKESVEAFLAAELE